MPAHNVLRSAETTLLWRRYARLVGTVTISLLLVAGMLEMVFSYREAREHIARLQRSQAAAAAREIEQYTSTIATGLRDAIKLPLGGADGTVQRREEFHRLMVLQPAIAELRQVDAQGRELLFVSRADADRRQEHPPSPLAPEAVAPQVMAARWGATYDRDGAEPWVHLTMSAADGGRTVATVNLRFLADVVSGLRSADGGETYVVDAANRLIAHPQASQVLRRHDLSAFAPVALARRHGAAAAPAMAGAVDALDVEGRPVIATAARVPTTDWLVLVVQPRSQALAPALATLWRTVALVALAGLAAMAVSVLFARRMAAPIVALRQATQRIAAGDLATPIALQGDDEIGQLAADFNTMAGQLSASYAGLEAKVADRTAALTDARDRLQAQAAELSRLNTRQVEQMAELARRREQAEQASAAKTRFLAAASHDLRQPMHTIGLLMGLLNERLRDEPAPPAGGGGDGDGGRPDDSPRRLGDKVSQSVDVMEALFSSLLDISKLDAGAMRPQLEDVALGPLLAQLGQTYAPQAAARGLRLVVVPSRAVVRSDPAWLMRMLGNLVANALRYTTHGGVVVGCRRRGPVGLALQVIDTGPGIAPEQQQQVFEEFVRLPQAGQASAAGQGLGLGLSIVRRSAELLGHGLVLRSQPGHGACFELLLPRVQAAAPPAGPATPSQAALQARLQGSFVLVIDDDADNREATAALCRQWGCITLPASGTADALRRLAEHLRSPDLLITDHRLGGGDDGFQAIEGLRQASAEATPAVLVTADVGAAIAQRAAALGVRLLHKPATPQALLRAAAAALAPAPPGAAPG